MAWLVGVAAGALIGLVHAFVSIPLRADQVVSGTGINFLALGITGYIFIYHYGDQGTPSDVSRAPDVTLPLMEDIPFIGDAIGQANLLTWAALLLVPLLSALPVPDARRAAAARPWARSRAPPTAVGLPVHAHALPRRDRLRRAGGPRRRVPVDRAARLVQRAA